MICMPTFSVLEIESSEALIPALPVCGGVVKSLGSSSPWCGPVEQVTSKLASCVPQQYTTNMVWGSSLGFFPINEEKRGQLCTQMG